MNEHSHIRIESPAFSSESVHLLDLSGREAISQLFEFHAQVASSDPAGLDVDALIGAPAVLVFERGGVETRRMGGLVAGIRDSMHEETGKMVYDLWFAPRAFRLGLVETYEIFMDLSVPEIVKKKLERAGLAENQDYELRLTASYAPREFVVQYQETDLAFVSRLLEHVGVCFFFEHKDGADLLVLSDANSGFAPPVDGKEVPFRSRGERQGVFSIESQTRMTPAQYVVKDYNYRTPQLALQATAPNDKGDGGFVMEYGAHFKNPDEGAVVARIRAEELAASRTIFDGKSDRHGFSAGAMVLLEGHPRGDMPLVLTEVHHRAATSALGTGRENARDYENSFKAIPGKTPYRPGRITPKPRIHGVITGVIDAAAKGPYAELDADGRYRVRFLFDAGDAGDGQASRLCRMAQPHGGGGFGMHFPLRSGVEVILTFVEGDPDRPIILGVVPNPQTPSPVTGGNGTRNIIRTGGGNEINIDDTAGGERIKLSTPHSKSVIQLGAPNMPTSGIGLLADGEISTVAKGTWNTVTPVMSAVSDYCKLVTALDIEFFATGLTNLSALVTACIGTGKDTAGLVQAVGDLATGRRWLEPLKEKADDLAREAAACQGRVNDAEASVAKAKAELDSFALAPPLRKSAAILKLREAEEELSKAKETHKGAAVQAAAAAKSASDSEAALDESLVAQAAKNAEGLAAVVDAAQPLVSAVVDLIAKAAEDAIWVLAETQVASATIQAKGGSLHVFVPPVAAPAFLGGGTTSAALLGGANVLVGAKGVATVAGDINALVTGGGQVVVKSPGLAELHGGTTAYVTSVSLVDIISLNMVRLDARAGALVARAGKDMLLETKETLEVKATMGMDFTSEKYAKLTAKDGLVDIIAPKGDISLKAHAEKSRLDLEEKAVKLSHDGWGLKIASKSIELGPLLDASPKLTLDTKKAQLMKNDTGIVVGQTSQGMGVFVKVGGDYLSVSKQGVKFVAKKLHLL